ncbi:alpha/beta hydrolase [Tsukamurella pulmonis]|uniref:alpha/beta hydrolase n=1 Tax=Tsukamurella pulmonis TaxID=47312 RepID=UPI0007933E79|nr:alpha/beta hydrolase [Tsukamurella pulmonis]KXO92147.1 alpha/beta hydrolase [Tsukamurella pulmonis]KXP09793.1 alpha/beta hydrolase [Tsukamurella pulmonis]RDH11632.1 alpha/beta hydrolase [Tsukamurella pulmonis]
MATTELTYSPDVLGDEYVAHTFELGPDPDGEPGGDVVATLVKHVPTSTAGATDPHHAVLWVHGFSDYFFQTAVAEFFAERGYAFYALDLRKCGRSLREGQSAHYATDFTVYDEELDLAVAAIEQEHPGLGVVVAAHSTGGLITPLWLDRRRKAGRTGPVVGLVLDSPWFDLQGSAMLRELATPVVKLIGKAVGTRPVPVEAVGVYGQTIHSSAHGEFDFDPRIKPIEGFPVRFGWLRAVRVAHSLLHRGLDVGVPSLVLRSTKSFAPKEWSEEAGRADVVLDTRQIAKWAGALGGRLTVIPVENAKHDVFLSEKDARETAYAELAGWLAREIEA